MLERLEHPRDSGFLEPAPELAPRRLDLVATDEHAIGVDDDLAKRRSARGLRRRWAGQQQPFCVVEVDALLEQVDPDMTRLAGEPAEALEAAFESEQHVGAGTTDAHERGVRR